MTSQNEQFTDRFLWLWEKGFFAFVVAGGLIVTAVIVFAVMLDSRLDNIEDQLDHTPSRSFQPPVLKNYAAGDVRPDDLPVRQWMYVPSYSHIYFNGGSPYSLETTLSIRNIDVDQPIYVKSVQYFDTNGKLIKSFVDQMIKLRPLQTIEFLVERRDSSGGSGANFLLELLSDTGVDMPVVKSVMVGTAGTQGICFGESGIEISPPNVENR